MPDAISLSHLLDNVSYIDPETIENLILKDQDFILYSDLKFQEQSLTWGDELIEIGKITGMGVLAATSYGIIHDLITTQIHFGYFSDLNLTHHGLVTLKHFPWVYHSESRILYALLWGTISTWWVGLPLGGLSAIAARIDPKSIKYTWHDLVKPISVLIAANLGAALMTGVMTYATTGDRFSAVAAMHNSSYLAGAAGGLLLPFYIYFSRPGFTGTLQSQCMHMTDTLLKLFKDNPDNPDILALIRFLLNSSNGNCHLPE
ncbi:hypothetical protein [Endozoicomonas ascidiicola]|uniref:hypothetical protein n=1 Tax=Endozoicomonas ascidiicola TaxID=1698521 RepID=UPI000829E0EC|nr:hypothetical protein [Endozoicomonas ascidiicola]